MKIAFVSLSGLSCHVAGAPGARGGAEVQTSLLAEAMRDRGHEVAVVVTDYDGEARRAPRLTDLPLVNAYNINAGLPGARFLAPRWTGLHRALASIDADVVFQMCAAAATVQLADACGKVQRL